MTSKALIPTSGGNDPHTGLPIQRVYCVVFEISRLEILAISDSRNVAQEIANSLYVDRQIDAIADEVRFHDDSIDTTNIFGFTLDQFEHFVENNQKHPLIAGK